MSYTRYAFAEAEENGRWGARWLIHAPWAHPAWRDYALDAYDLVERPGDRPPVFYLAGATHEMILHAINPDTPIDFDVPVLTQKVGFLSPANLRYQFVAADNAAARVRLQVLVQEIAALRLSPDTDFRAMWDQGFADGATLLKKSLLHGD